MNVEVVKRYNDLELNKVKSPGDTFETGKARAELLIRKGFAKELKSKQKEPAKK